MDISTMVNGIQAVSAMTPSLLAATASMNKQSVSEIAPIEQSKSSTEIADYIKGNPGYVPSVQEKTIINAIEKANQKLSGTDREFEFSVHEKTKQIMVKVIDKQSKEVIREIPSEKILDMVAKLCELNGLFVDEKR